MKLIFLGVPGAGKGTQADVVADKYGISTVSTGNVLREAVKNGTKLGLEAKSFMDSGALVPDELVISIIKDRLAMDDCVKGFILDGFPRTIPQAEALEKMGVSVDRVMNIEVDDEAIVVRMSGRRVCGDCGDSYHIEYKPSKDNKTCNKCGGNLIIRKDDCPDTVRQRLNVYHEQTEPLKEYYDNKGILKTVVGQIEVKDTTKLTLLALEDLN